MTGIGSYASEGCTSLASITIPSRVTSIVKSDFLDCTSLASVTFADTTTCYITIISIYWQDKIGGMQTEVTDPNANENYFDIYRNHYWYKK
ncbi:MAG: leucine-rich repeat protein [Clostridia bacterium]|nr:leucine-rich repeat protein [Clostridia bacterium]